MTKAGVIAFTATIWAAGFAAAGALAYTVSKPPPQLATIGAIAHAPPARAAKIPRIDEGRVIVLPTVEFVTAKVRPPATPKVDPPRDISQMHCAEWRPLMQGSSSVQMCD